MSAFVNIGGWVLIFLCVISIASIPLEVGKHCKPKTGFEAACEVLLQLAVLLWVIATKL